MITWPFGYKIGSLDYVIHLIALFLLITYSTSSVAQINGIESVAHNTQNGDVIIKFKLTYPLSQTPLSFSINNPPRYVMDMPSTRNLIGENVYRINTESITSINLVQTGERTRIVFNLTHRTDPTVRLISGNILEVIVHGKVSSVLEAQKRISELDNSLSEMRHLLSSRTQAKSATDVEHEQGTITPKEKTLTANQTSEKPANAGKPEEGKAFSGFGVAGLAVTLILVVLVVARRTRSPKEPIELTEQFSDSDIGRCWLYFDSIRTKTVIFVHGIFSGPEAFFDPKTKIFWPDLVHNDNRLDHPNIYLAQFFTNFYSGNFDIPHAADELRVQLMTQAQNSQPAPINCSELVFVAHSTGGLVVRDLLTRCPEIFRGKKVGLVLVASPSRGSAWADRLKMLIDIAGNKMAGELRRGSDLIYDLDRRFADFVHKDQDERGFILRGLDLFENHFICSKTFLNMYVYTRSVVVSDRESSSYFGAGRIVPNTDHFSIAKPFGINHASHRYLVEWWLNQFNKA